jgi:hypothetical protein
VTFKDLKRIIVEKNKEMERKSKFHNPSHYWKGKKIVSLNEWLKIKNNYGLSTALQYFPNDFLQIWSYFHFVWYRGSNTETGS